VGVIVTAVGVVPEALAAGALSVFVEVQVDLSVQGGGEGGGEGMSAGRLCSSSLELCHT
jgi:hypothetical protein